MRSFLAVDSAPHHAHTTSVKSSMRRCRLVLCLCPCVDAAPFSEFSIKFNSRFFPLVFFLSQPRILVQRSKTINTSSQEIHHFAAFSLATKRQVNRKPFVCNVISSAPERNSGAAGFGANRGRRDSTVGKREEAADDGDREEEESACDDDGEGKGSVSSDGEEEEESANDGDEEKENSACDHEGGGKEQEEPAGDNIAENNDLDFKVNVLNVPFRSDTADKFEKLYCM